MSDIEVGASGERIRSSAADRIIVRLSENATTGYQWSIAEMTDVLDVESNELVLPSALVPGAGGQRVLVLRPVGIGRGRVLLTLQRRWEPEPVERFEFYVDVVES